MLVASRALLARWDDAVKLTLGRRNASAIEVKAGLAPGDRVSRVQP